jgi:hypothetical protein
MTYITWVYIIDVYFANSMLVCVPVLILMQPTGTQKLWRQRCVLSVTCELKCASSCNTCVVAECAAASGDSSCIEGHHHRARICCHPIHSALAIHAAQPSVVAPDASATLLAHFATVQSPTAAVLVTCSSHRSVLETSIDFVLIAIVSSEF